MCGRESGSTDETKRPSLSVGGAVVQRAATPGAGDGRQAAALRPMPNARCVVSHGFEFLGYRFEAGRRWVRKISRMGLRDRIRALTKCHWGNSIESIIASRSRKACVDGP